MNALIWAAEKSGTAFSFYYTKRTKVLISGYFLPDLFREVIHFTWLYLHVVRSAELCNL